MEVLRLHSPSGDRTSRPQLDQFELYTTVAMANIAGREQIDAFSNLSPARGHDALGASHWHK